MSAIGVVALTLKWSIESLEMIYGMISMNVKTVIIIHGIMSIGLNAGEILMEASRDGKYEIQW